MECQTPTNTAFSSTPFLLHHTPHCPVSFLFFVPELPVSMILINAAVMFMISFLKAQVCVLLCDSTLLPLSRHLMPVANYVYVSSPYTVNGTRLSSILSGVVIAWELGECSKSSFFWVLLTRHGSMEEHYPWLGSLAGLAHSLAVLCRG